MATMLGTAQRVARWRHHTNEQARLERDREVGRLQKLAGDLRYSDPGLAQAYADKAATVAARPLPAPGEPPSQTPDQVVKAAVAASDRRHAAMSARLDVLERSIAAERRPIGMAAPPPVSARPAVATKAAGTPRPTAEQEHARLLRLAATVPDRILADGYRLKAAELAAGLHR